MSWVMDRVANHFTVDQSGIFMQFISGLGEMIPKPVDDVLSPEKRPQCCLWSLFQRGKTT